MGAAKLNPAGIFDWRLSPAAVGRRKPAASLSGCRSGHLLRQVQARSGSRWRWPKRTAANSASATRSCIRRGRGPCSTKAWIGGRRARWRSAVSRWPVGGNDRLARTAMCFAVLCLSHRISPPGYLVPPFVVHASATCRPAVNLLGK